MSTNEQVAKQRTVDMFDAQGREIPDPTPVEIPVHLNIRHSDHIRDIIRQELSRFAEDQGHETFEEADDFDCDDDFDPASPYEEFFDPDTGESNFTRSVASRDTSPEGTPPPALSTGVPSAPAEGGEAPAAPAAGDNSTVGT